MNREHIQSGELGATSTVTVMLWLQVFNGVFTVMENKNKMESPHWGIDILFTFGKFTLATLTKIYYEPREE